MKTLFETTTGSRAYGLELDLSDHDVLRVVAHGEDEYLGLTGYKDSAQFKNGGQDVTVYDVRFYGKLLLAGNPNAVLPLFFDKKNRLEVAPEFESWLLLPRRFLGPKTVDSFRGMVYRQSQEFREDVAKNELTSASWKKAANAMYMLWALKSLVRLGGLDTSCASVQMFREVKKGLLDVTTVQRELVWLEKITTKENLTGHGSLLLSQEEVFNNVNTEVVNTVRSCLES